MSPHYPTIADCVGNTPLVRLQRLPGNTSNTLLLKLEGNNPAGSVKDRPALSMITRAEQRGDIQPGDVLIEATSGNTGIALAMAAAIKGYRMVLIMPDNSTAERKAAMTAYGAQLILVGGMEEARDLALQMQADGKGKVLDQFANGDNPIAHYTSTGPEIWQQTGGQITHFVSSMGTTGTIMGVSRYLKEQNAAVQIVGLQPMEGASIPGIRRWPEEYLPKIYNATRVDRIIDMAQTNFDYVVIDMPKTIVAWTETVLSQAHVYFAMMDLDLRSAQNVLRLVRALKAETLPHEKLRYVLNRAPKFTDLSAKSRVKRMSESLDITLEVQIPDGGAQVTQANDHGHPLAQSAPKNPVRKEIQKLAAKLHEMNKAVEAGKK